MVKLGRMGAPILVASKRPQFHLNKIHRIKEKESYT
jgi:hypothetical protein